mgnify:CR=1 FL=1
MFGTSCALLRVECFVRKSVSTPNSTTPNLKLTMTNVGNFSVFHVIGASQSEPHSFVAKRAEAQCIIVRAYRNFSIVIKNPSAFDPMYWLHRSVSQRSTVSWFRIEKFFISRDFYIKNR